MNLKPWINKTLKELNFGKLTDIQKATIPKILLKKNIIGISETGTGKTLSFLLPILDKIDYSLNEIQAIIVSPTKELARQIFSQITLFKKNNEQLSSTLLIKNTLDVNLNKKINSHIVVATPQKLNEFVEKKLIISTYIKMIVLDEADMLIDLNFIGLLEHILFSFKNYNQIQKVAFSATIHEMVITKIKKVFKSADVISTLDKIWVNKNITNNVIHYLPKEKKDILLQLINILKPYFCIVFCNTQKDVDELFQLLFPFFKSKITKLHGKLSDRERKQNYNDLINDNKTILIATDIASRGIDINGVSHIFSYDMPDEDIWYIHRSGRTGRNNTTGNSYVFFDEQSKYQINRLAKKGINWIDWKLSKDKLIKVNATHKQKTKKRTEVDEEIKKIINLAPKKTYPNCKKHIKLKIKKVKQKAKRQRIEHLMNQQRIKSYKIKNANKKKNTLI